MNSFFDLKDKTIDSRLIFGTATPKLFAAVSENATADDKEEAFRLLDMVYENGITTFDCAAHYGEVIMGQWLEARNRHEKCVVITKCAHPNEYRHRVSDFDILADAHNSLKKLKTNCLDIFMLHRDNKSVPVSIIVDALNRLYQEGKVKVFGGSNWTHERIEQANEYALKHGMEPFRVSSPNFGLAEQIDDPWRDDAPFGDGCVTISGPENKAARKWYKNSKIPVFAYSSLARGFFSGAFSSDCPEKAMEIMDKPGITGYYCERNIERLKRCETLAAQKGVTVSQIAFAWIFNQPMDVYAVTSPVTESQLKSSIDAMNIKLTTDECAWLDLENNLQND